LKLRDDLRTFITDELLADEEPLEFDDNLLDDGMVDSLGAVRLVMYIEEEFGYAIPPEDLTMENFRTIDALATYLEPHLDDAG
jgi:acyl carrier protein